MTIIGIDDTDSRKLGMCTTYVGHRVATMIENQGYTVHRTLLIRLNPAVKHKTRGNAAVAIHTDAPLDIAFNIATDYVQDVAEVDDERTHPGVVGLDSDTAPDSVQDVSKRAISEILTIDEISCLLDKEGLKQFSMGKGRGRIGATAAVGAWDSYNDWTYEHISYREPEKWGTERNVDPESMFSASDEYYPLAWDTVDKVEGETVAAPHTPCPILYGVRGDDKSAVQNLSAEIEGEPVYRSHTFITNQGTDMHLFESDITNLEENKAYKVSGVVTNSPHTQEGGHVFFQLQDDTGSVRCAAFEPTKRFRDVIRNLREGDEVVVCGEYKKDSIKLEKIRVVSLDTVEYTNPTCPDCGCSMKSAGANQGYRCRDCKTSSEEKDESYVDRDLETGWYEVPPCARRHIAKPLIRGGFPGKAHPQR